MNHYTFDEMKIGMSYSFDETVSDEDMELFAKLSGDLNPMHVDADYSRKNGGFKDKVVYGMLASSYYSTLVGMYLPGEKCFLNKIEIDFKRPVFVGDKLTIYGEVSDIREATRRVKIKGKTVNQDNTLVNTAEIVVSFTGGINNG